jgi:hypothetical protein
LAVVYDGGVNNKTPLLILILAAATHSLAHAADVPYGISVPGKPGFVTSPHAPNAGFVDARGILPGTEIKDPYTGRIFLVP